MHVYDVAVYIIDALKVNGEPTVTNLALNKLLYFAQGHFLAQTGDLLFEDDFAAWDLGPVVPIIYHICKPFGHSPVILTDRNQAQSPDEFESAVLDDVIREYGIYSAFHLVNLSHKEGSPWSMVGRNEVIPAQLIAEHFAQNPLEVSDEELDADRATFDGLMANFSEDDYVSEDEAFGV